MKKTIKKMTDFSELTGVNFKDQKKNKIFFKIMSILYIICGIIAKYIINIFR